MMERDKTTMPLMSDLLSWCVFLIGAFIVLNLLWGAIKASFKLVFYAVLILLFIAFLKRYDLLPQKVNQWIESQKLITEIRDRFHEEEGSDRKNPMGLQLSGEDKAEVPISYSSKSGLSNSTQGDEEEPE